MLSTLMLPALLLAFSPPALAPRGDRFVDAQGRQVVLRGVNVSCDAKLPPFTVVQQSDLDALPAMGMNVVRLLFVWEAFEPTRGHYDAAYLAYYRGLVDAAQARGLFVVVDFHQDAMARSLIGGCGDGFPAWAIARDIAQSAPDNGERCALWQVKMALSRDLARAWRAFYRNSGGARDAYLDMVGHVAAALADAPMVLGYDLLNEPHGDEAGEIAPLYEDAARRVHAVDPGAMIFASPAFTTSTGRISHMPRPRIENLVYAPHVYEFWLLGLHVWFGNAQRRAFAHMQQVARAWDVPLFIGEFGAPAAVAQSRGYLRAIYAQLDDAGLSGAQWCYTRRWTESRRDGWNAEDLSMLDATGAARYAFEPRPFAAALAGIDGHGTHDPDRRHYELVWENDPRAGATEIVVPTLAGTEPRVEAHGDGLICRVDSMVGRASCSSPHAGAMHVSLDY